MLSLALLLLLQDPLADLDSTDPAKARRAFEAAIRAGDEKALEAAAKTSEQAKRALAEVRAHKRFGDAYPPVPLYTVSIKDKSLEEALALLGKALGVPAEEPHKPPAGFKKDEAPVSVEIHDAYFLEAMELFAAASKTYPWLAGDGIKCSQFAPPPSGPKFFWRNFVLVADSLKEQRTVRTSGSSRTTALELRMMFAGNPRLTGVQRVVVLEARDD